MGASLLAVAKSIYYFRKQAFLDMDRWERDEIMKGCASLVMEIQRMQNS